MSYIGEGSPVPLNLQLFDGWEGALVRCAIIDQYGKLLEQVELEHTVAGQYRSLAFKMPAIPFITATYVVYDGKKESKDYERVADIFYLDTMGPTLAEAASAIQGGIDGLSKGVSSIQEALQPVDWIVGELVSVIAPDDGFTEGVSE